MTDISIAMSTYNGERYLPEQLDSLARQTEPPLELVVGDDGSTDRTLEILHRFATTAPFPVHVTSNETNLGFADNFLTTAARCGGRWIAFCDQDDVWLPRRIANANRAINRGDDDMLLVVQAAEIVDAELKRTGRKLPNIRRDRTFNRNGHYLFWVEVGFAQTFRADLVRSLDWSTRPTNEHPGHRWQSHDQWICMLANLLGRVHCDSEVAALYRRHDATVTGEYEQQALVTKASTALAAGKEEYLFLQRVATEYRDKLRDLAAQSANRQWQDRLRQGADWYDRLAEIQSSRAALNDSYSRLARLRQLKRNIMLGGYWGRPPVARGSKSFLKDLFVALRPAAVYLRENRMR